MPTGHAHRVNFAAPVRGWGFDLVFAGPDINGRRRALVQTLQATDIWRAVPSHVNRLWLAVSLRTQSERVQALDLLCAILIDAGEEARTVAALDWVMYPEFHDSGYRAKLGIAHYDRARAAALDAARDPLLGPWLDGARPVRNLEAFRAFHTQLPSAERTAVRLVLAGYHRGHYRGPIDANPIPGTPGGWFAATIPGLLVSGWLEVASSSSGKTDVLVPGRVLRRMAHAQGELLEA